MKPIAILGTGPAGLMAAHACAMAGRPIALFSKPGEGGKIPKSKLGGAQFLHDPIPGINNEEDPDATVIYECWGDVLDYKRKVYGEDPTVLPEDTSMHAVHDGKEQPAWNLQRTYDKLWDLLSADKANGVDINPMWLDHVIGEQWFDAIISSIPAPALCMSHAGIIGENHLFVQQTVSISNDNILEDLPNNRIVYNGSPDYSWYRCSKLFGVGSTEWSAEGPMPPQTDLVTVKKPLRTTCNCYPDILRVGRYGTWVKGVLSSSAFTTTMKVFL